MALPYRGEKHAGVVAGAVRHRGRQRSDTPFSRRSDLSDFDCFRRVFTTPHTPLPPHQLVFNAIGDADMESPALAAAQRVLALTTAPVINQPAAVAATGRSDNAQRLSGIPGVVTPGAVTLPRALLAGRGRRDDARPSRFRIPSADPDARLSHGAPLPSGRDGRGSCPRRSPNFLATS